MRLILLAAGLIGLYAIPLIIFGDRFDGAGLLEILQSDSPWAALLGVAAISADLVIPFPAHAIMTGFGMSQGWFVGGLLGAAGTFGAGVLVYWQCRLLGQRVVTFIAGNDNAVRRRASLNAMACGRLQCPAGSP